MKQNVHVQHYASTSISVTPARRPHANSALRLCIHSPDRATVACLKHSTLEITVSSKRNYLESTCEGTVLQSYSTLQASGVSVIPQPPMAAITDTLHLLMTWAANNTKICTFVLVPGSYAPKTFRACSKSQSAANKEKLDGWTR